ncbi:hypothetical protein [Streptacidiphilus neutrinimicus]|uniref:hypothetical protein n=1 Tax=Streptacidiphilus neutrinimicus TaxID=105420 RepID=UPI0005A84AD7|nr:hypothetical protein [Streptacidiphilus neutrinimicus]
MAAVIGEAGGLGRALTALALRRGLHAVRFGSAEDCAGGPQEAELRLTDLADAAQPWSVDPALPGPALVFWVAGRFLQQPFAELNPTDAEALTRQSLTGPAALLARILAATPHPVHLVTAGSVSAWRPRQHQAYYCALRAGQSALTRNLLPELLEHSPHGRVTLVELGGLAVPALPGHPTPDFGAMLDPAQVADLVWDVAHEQTGPLAHAVVQRDKRPGAEGVPLLSFHDAVPEPPVRADPDTLAHTDRHPVGPEPEPFRA